MKSVAIIPIKENSKRVKGKNFRLFAGEPLYQYFLKKIIEHPFDAVFVDTDSDEVKEYTVSMGWNVIDRLPELATDTANGNDLLLYEASQVDADIYFQLFITSPLLKTASIQRAYEIMVTELSYDSLFTATEIYSWFWYDGEPVNYNPKVLPRSQDAVPIVRETTGLYAIRKDALLSQKCRIGSKPYMLFVDEIEAVDVDTELDFRLAEFLTQDRT